MSPLRRARLTTTILALLLIVLLALAIWGWQRTGDEPIPTTTPATTTPTTAATTTMPPTTTRRPLSQAERAWLFRLQGIRRQLTHTYQPLRRDPAQLAAAARLARSCRPALRHAVPPRLVGSASWASGGCRWYAKAAASTNEARRSLGTSPARATRLLARAAAQHRKGARWLAMAEARARNVLA